MASCNSGFRLGLPTDIPWKKICVTEDMMDREVCDNELPPKWKSSIAVFKYVPEEHFQTYPDMTISYLKVTATITGYQPHDDEIQGEINWDDLNVTTKEGLTELLQSYYPCNGAILQVTVGPEEEKVPMAQYPYFLDFEPKKRELYEMATDTKEKLSRSLETLHLTKSAGSVQSTEVLDIDMGGGGFSVAGEGSYMGSGGGGSFAYTAPNGQWGTKSMNTDQSQVARSTDKGTEQREMYAYTTHLSQMYHLLDSYHLGTNRAVFFVQPRPHVIEEPTGFVRGPRKVEGIQEFFLVVAQPKEVKDYCVSVRLDTSHLVESDILEYEYRTDVTDLASATARFPTRKDQPAGTTTRRACFAFCWDVTYQCFMTHDEEDVVYTAPDGFVIDGYDDLVNSTNRGSTSVSIAPGNKTLTIHAEANGHVCFEGSGVCVDCPDEVDKWSGHARRQLQVRLRSETPIKKVGTQQSLLITTRGLCCCDHKKPTNPNKDHNILDIFDIPAPIGGVKFDYIDPTVFTHGSYVNQDVHSPITGPTNRVNPASAAFQANLTNLTNLASPVHSSIPASQANPAESGLAQGTDHHSCNCHQHPQTSHPHHAHHENTAAENIRQANEMNNFIIDKMKQTFTTADPEQGKRFVETELFSRFLVSNLRRTRLGRKQLNTPVKKTVGDEVVKEAAKYFNKKADEITFSEMLQLRDDGLARQLKLDTRKLMNAKMNMLKSLR